jgi:hypothetical protein
MSRRPKPVWDEVESIAQKKGARFPELVAAQWALESGWGAKTSGKHNYFGLKSTGPAKATLATTQEEEGGEMVTIQDWFLDFDSLEACIAYLVQRWYQDWRGHKGVNRAADRNAAAHLLQAEGYATDSKYASKLIGLMDKHAAATVQLVRPVQQASAQAGPLVRLEALHDTWLKKGMEQATELPEKERHPVGRGRIYEVLEWIEVPQDAHAKVVLAHGAGTWFIWEPHWRKLTGAGEAMPRQVDWSDFQSLVTPHLTVGEVLRWDPRRIPSAAGDKRRIIETAKQFEAIRAAWGGPIGVTSFFRPPAVNAAVGGVPNSTHISGQAMDVYPVGRSIHAFYQWMLPRWSGALGDARPRGFLHLDRRPEGNGRFVPGGGVRPWVTWIY